jgi:PAS domain S-box-containing protein
LADAAYVGSIVDLTDRKRDEEASAYLAAIVASSDDAIIAKDLEGIIQSCNASVERVFGYSPSELIGRPVRILIPQDRQAEEDVILAKIRRGERIDHFETVRVTKSGRLVDISLTVSPVRDESGAIIGVSKMARDITERRRAEAAIAAERRRLDVLRQSAASDRDRLLEAERAARAEAERASRVKDEFIAMVSHELRTPLNAILGWTQLIASERANQTLLEQGLEVIARNTRAQAQVIADLLDVSRIVAGKLRLEVQWMSLSTIIDGAIETVERQAADKQVRLARHIDASVPPVAGDPGRIRQVVWNLLANAIKFTPPGGQVDITLDMSEGDVRLVVTDTGVGIRADVLPHVFDRFHQADGSSTRRFSGLGLGLAIVKHLVELHGGTVAARSEGDGLGSSFEITLPLATPLATSAVRGGDGTGEPAHPLALDAVRILLVEDEPDTREYLLRFLQASGASVMTARTAAEAVALYRLEPPDLLISDIGLPETDGYDLIQRLAREPTTTRPIPAIALTAYARPEDRERALQAGFQYYVAKPAEPATLLAIVGAVVKQLRDGTR